MDLMTVMIGIGLVLTGAVFVGYPIGIAMERRQFRYEIDDESEKLFIIPASFRRGKNDVLNAEILEVK